MARGLHWIGASSRANEELDLSDGGLISPSQFVIVARRPALQLLELQGNQLGCDGVASLVQALRAGCHLRFLGLARNDIGERGGCVLAEWLASGGASLQTIDLQDNQLGDRAAGALASMLQRNNQLQARVSPIESRACPAVRALCAVRCAARGREVRVCAQHLSLLHNAIGQSGALALATSLGTNRTLATLDLRLNLIDEHELQAALTCTAAASCPKIPSSAPGRPSWSRRGGPASEGGASARAARPLVSSRQWRNP